MSDRNPSSILYDSNSIETAVTASVQVPSASRGYVSVGVGTDGVTRFINVDSAGSLKITGSVGLATSSLPVVVIAQPNVTGSVNVTNTLFNITGSVGIATASIPVVIVNQPTITGSVNVTNTLFNVTGSVGLATASIPVVVLAHPQFSGSVNVTNTLFNVTGSVGIANQVTIVGPAASGSTFSGQPVLIAGIDASNFVRIPFLESDGTQIVRQREEATFIVPVTGSAIANNKSMISILNASSTKLVKIREIYITNAQITSVTGIVGLFELRRITGHSAGTAVTAVEQMDTNDTLDASVTVRTNATVSGESLNLLKRVHWSTDDWGVGTLDQEGYDHAIQAIFPVLYRYDPNTKPLTLRQNQGLTVKHTVNSTAGTFDLVIVFTQTP